jgi:glutamine cyclotransferase
MKQQHLTIILALLTVIIASSVTLILLNNSTADPDSSPNVPIEPETLNYTYNIVNVYPHDEAAFTQGLVFEDGILYEGTGRRGESTLRRVDLETGEVIQVYGLPEQFFGEGITVFGDKIIQLTYTSGKGFVYDKNSFDLLQEFEYPTDQGWGITYNDSALIMSDGSATLYFLDPATFQSVGQVEVHDEEPVTSLNELEYINGSVYANIWKEDKIAIINPQNGQVTGWIDLGGLRDSVNQLTSDVLNGIAYDQKTGRLFVTGKLWSKLFEIELVPTE